MQVPVYNTSGEVVRNIEVSDAVFAAPLNEAVVHQVMVAQRGNRRQGTAATKGRSQISASTRKLYRQKGTGFARTGSRRSPLRKGGGIIFGPQPRDYRQTVPRKMRRTAIRAVLSAKAGDGEVKVVEELKFDQPKTRVMAGVLNALGVDSSALIVTAAPEENLVKSARNLPRTKTMPANLLNVLDMLSYKMLLMTEPAVRLVERLWANDKVERKTDAPV